MIDGLRKNSKNSVNLNAVDDPSRKDSTQTGSDPTENKQSNEKKMLNVLNYV